MHLQVSSFSQSTTMSKHQLVGKPAPALSLPNADGTTFDYKPGADGKPTAIFFYPAAGPFPCLSFVVTPRFISWEIHRHLWLHKRSLQFPGCAHWYVMPRHLPSREDTD